MDHIAIDLGGKESQICVRSSDGTIIEERRHATPIIGRWLRRRPPSRVILETCAEAFAIADVALECGHDVRVVPCALVRSLGVGARGVKTDRRDAQALSEASCRIELPSVHIPSAISRRRKSLCGMREALVGARTRIVNTVYGWLRTHNHRIPTGCTETFTRRVRAALEKHPDGMPLFVQRQLEAIDQLSIQVVAADSELVAEATADATCKRLMTVPGVGPVTAVRFIACIDDLGRFADAHAVESYIGLVPGERSSSERQHRTGITKAGSTRLRWALVQATWSARRTRKSDPMVQWCLEIERRRGRRIAMVALARKLAGVLFAVWRDGSAYNPTHQRRQLPEPAAAE